VSNRIFELLLLLSASGDNALDGYEILHKSAFRLFKDARNVNCLPVRVPPHGSRLLLVLVVGWKTCDGKRKKGNNVTYVLISYNISPNIHLIKNYFYYKMLIKGY
jgi:hypothetical protein